MGIGGPTKRDPLAGWWDWEQDRIIATNLVPGSTAVSYPVADLQSIAEGMGRLRPGSDQLATPLAVNNPPHMQDIQVAMVHILRSVRGSCLIQ